MKASYQWIRELLPDLRRSQEELAALFTGAGLEVEALHRYGEAEGASAYDTARDVLTYAI